MATTRLMTIHACSGRTIADVIDYVENPEKTRNGELILAHECDSRTADAEFLLSKKQYATLTGRDQGQGDVIAYHLRQSFPPGEVTPEQAQQVGWELAMRWTKGRHAFIVCTHVDREHVHSHIIYNSTALDCRHKFRNFLGSAFALRRLSDRICLEHGLSIIENPKPRSKSRYQHYGQWLGEDRQPSYRERLRQAIDAVLEKSPKDFDDFLRQMEAQGYRIERGKYPTFFAPGHKKGTRLRENSMGADYTETAIRARIEGRHTPSGGPAAPDGIALLIDIQQKILDGKGPAYERWAKIFNLKQAAKTLSYLQENGGMTVDALTEKVQAATAHANDLEAQVKALDDALRDNAALQRHIVNYSKTRDVYTQYRKAGYSKKFRAAHAEEIQLHQEAKRAFDALGGKVPTISSLRAQYALDLDEKKRAYRDYRQARTDMRELLTVKENVDRLLGYSDGKDAQSQDQSR